MSRLVAKVLVVMLLTLGSVAFADDTTDPDARARHDLAQQVVALTTGGQITQSIVDATWPADEQLFRKDNPNIEQSTLDSLKQTLADAMHGVIGDLTAPLIDAYAQQFTADELKALLAFYQSPLGVKVLTTTPLILKQVTPVLLERERELLPKIVEQLMQAAKDKGLNLTS